MSIRGFASLSIRLLLAGFILTIIFPTTGCGKGGNINSGLSTSASATPITQIRIGDTPEDSVIDFQITIASPINLQPSGGGAKVPVAVGANRVELSHMAAKLEPLALLNIPTGTYVSADITINNSEVTFLNSVGAPVTLNGPTVQTVTVTFSPAITIGSTPSIVNIDLDIANSLVTNAGAIIGLSFSPSSFIVSSGTIAAGSQQDDTGEIEALTGTVSSVNGANFTLNAGQSGAQLPFTTDGTTQFTDGLTTLASALNQVVKVEGVTKSDGTLLAKEVEGIEGQTGAEIDGLITQVTPSTSLTIVAHDGIGSGMDNTKVGATFTANVTGLAAGKYVIDNRGLDFSGLTVPGASFPFDATTIHAGQRVEVESPGAIPAAGGTITADKVRLEQQAISGAVSNFAAGAGGKATFDLTLPVDSYLGLITGQTVVHVFEQAGTDNRFGTITNTSTVRVRGLLFWTGTTFNLIARRITP
ncbi:MAG: DUF5666 domain-containing protein [Acidobacteriia bacterium]|nr:DUF5666 domain-containing protein [Terriglobia bacterium]